MRSGRPIFDAAFEAFLFSPPSLAGISTCVDWSALVSTPGGENSTTSTKEETNRARGSEKNKADDAYHRRCGIVYNLFNIYDFVVNGEKQCFGLQKKANRKMIKICDLVLSTIWHPCTFISYGYMRVACYRCMCCWSLRIARC